MGGASKFLVPLATPAPTPLRLTRSSDIPLAALSLSYGRRLLSFTQRTKLRFSVRGAAAQAHAEVGGVRGAAAQAHAEVGGVRGAADGEVPLPFPCSSIVDPWPEWARFLDFILARGYSDRNGAALEDDDDSLLDGEHLAEEFVKAAEACLLFARDQPDLLRSLQKKDIEIIVENGSPFLFKNGLNSARRLRSFLSVHSDNVKVPETETAQTIDLMRYLLSYSCISYSSKHDEHLKVRQHIEIPIRNLLVELVKETTAVEKFRLDESTAKPTTSRQQLSRPGQNFEMKRGDWICQKCSFLNFARNMRCLECNDTRPKRVLTGGEWECPQCDFYNYGRNTSCLRCDCKCPREEPPSLAASGVGLPYNRCSTVQSDSFRASGLSGVEPNAVSASSISKRLDSIIGRSSTTSGIRRRLISSERDNGTGISSEQSESIPIQRRDPDYVPFVPLPNDMFSNSQKSNNDLRQSSLEQDSASPIGTYRMSDPTVKKSERMLENNDKDSFDMAEKWSKKVAELDDASDLANSVSDDDFPEIMPMRKGENRFVISKKKDRSLTSPQYKRRIALEQASTSNYVPFVPFPAGYFANKDTQPETSTKDSPSGGLVTDEKAQTVPAKSDENMTDASNLVSSGNATLLPETKTTSKPSGANSSGENIKGSKVGSAYDIAATTSVGSPGNSWTNSNKNRNNEHNSSTRRFDNAIAKVQQSESSESAEGKTSLGGKSLEGSLVKEPDPLDMSEEAKAARWFRRVAQIKDISELSNIPDEDFPEIMPMRKGVNRFVVSKRKTPLERRLTSSRYTKNLPVINSDPDKDAS